MKTLREIKTKERRREFVEEQRNIKLDAISRVFIDDESDVHCENLIGATSIPLGIAGPLGIRSQGSEVREYFVPLATTEGALVASVSRGCKAILESGGAILQTDRVGTTRGPVFYTGSIEDGQKLSDWIKSHILACAKIAEETSHHLKFKNVKVSHTSDHLFIRFSFDTDEAMGMNMATIASQEICKFIEQETGFSCVTVAGNFDIDKKPAWLNFIEGRGTKVWAEVILTPQIIKDVLKTTPQKLFDVWYAKCVLGSIMSGSLGFNSHFANVVAALFIATGQDPAHVVEGSLGVTTTKMLPDGNLYISIYLPDLMIGIVGGGTKLKTQKEALSIIGAKNILEFGEVIGASVLAGEISLLASLAEGTLASSHKKLGR